MLRRIFLSGMIVTLLCLAMVVAGCAATSSASAISIDAPPAVSAVDQSDGNETVKAATDEQNEVTESEEVATGEQAEDSEKKAPVDDGVQVVSAFNGQNGEFPEGLAIDKPGNIYVSVGFPFWFPVEESFGEIWKISPDGEIAVLHAFPGGPGPAGLAVNPSGELYFAYPNPFDPAANGVYRLAGDGDPERLPGSENIGLANGLALTKQGDLFVSDSMLGAVWRIAHDGTAAGIWFQDELLAGCDPDDFFVGANGIAFWKDSLYVANTSRGMLVRVPFLDDGSAGDLEIVTGDEDCDPPSDPLFGIDGITLDVHGNIFALLVLQNKLMRIDPVDGSHVELLNVDDGLYNPASITFGTGKGNRQQVFLSNFALIPPPPSDNSFGPGVLSYDVGVPGLPLP